MENQFRWIIVVLLFVIWLASISSPESAEIYKWKDKDGNIIFSDTPPPPGVDVEVKEFKENTIERPKAKENINLPRPKSESFREKRSYSDIHVIMYMTSWCPYCDKTRAYLRSLDVNLVEYNIERDRSKREEMLSKSGGSSGVPLIDVEGIIIRGYNPSAFRAAIERRRSL
jgi:glutaredoxin